MKFIRQGKYSCTWKCPEYPRFTIYGNFMDGKLRSYTLTDEDSFLLVDRIALRSCVKAAERYIKKEAEERGRYETH